MSKKRIILLLASTVLVIANTRSIYSEEQLWQNSNILPEQKTEQKSPDGPETPTFSSRPNSHETETFSGKKVTELRGYFKILHNQDELSQFRIFYNGMETMSNSEGFFSFPLPDGKPNELTLIISKQIFPQFEKTNTIKNLLLDQTKKYKAYTLKQTNFGGLTWEEKKIVPELTITQTTPGKHGSKQKQLPNKNCAIPQNSIVVLVDPKYVDHLEKWPIEFADNDIHLPQILLKAHKELKIDHAANKSVLYNCNLTPFHEKIAPREKEMEKGSIILPW